LEPFVTGMSVVRMTVRISVVDDFEVPLTTLYDCVTQENHIGSQGNTDCKEGLVQSLRPQPCVHK